MAEKKYGRDRSQVLLNTNSGPVVIAVAIDAGWAQIMVDKMNRGDAEIEEKSATTKASS